MRCMFGSGTNISGYPNAGTYDKTYFDYNTSTHIFTCKKACSVKVVWWSGWGQYSYSGGTLTYNGTNLVSTKQYNGGALVKDMTLSVGDTFYTVYTTERNTATGWFNIYLVN